MLGVLRFCLVILILAASSARAAAPLLAAGSPSATPDRPSHGWLIVPSPAVVAQPGKPAPLDPGCTLLHLPPRRGSLMAGVDSLDGVAKLVTTLYATPDAITAQDADVILVFPIESAETIVRRPVLRVRATLNANTGSWLYDTQGARLVALPSLPGQGRSVALASTAVDVVALLDDQLLVLGDGRWEPIDLPPGLADSSGRLLTASGTDSISIVATASLSTLWSGTLTWRPATPIMGPAARGERISRRQPQINWQRRDILWPQHATSLHVVAGQRIAMVPAGTSLGVVALSNLAPRVLAEVPWSAAEPPAVLTLDDVGRLGLVGRSAADPGAAVDRGSARRVPRLSITELSTHTGAVMYAGPLKTPPPVVADELRLLGFAAAGAMLAVVLIVVRPGGSPDALPLPRGIGPADSGRRLGAALIDVVVAALIASLITGQSVLNVLSIVAILTKPGVIDAFLLTLAVGLVLSAVLEGLVGFTVGKLILGLRVVRVVIDVSADGTRTPRLRPPGIPRALLRNAVRWLAPPIAMGGLSSLDGRHRGDLAASTVVVARHREGD